MHKDNMHIFSWFLGMDGLYNPSKPADFEHVLTVGFWPPALLNVTYSANSTAT